MEARGKLPLHMHSPTVVGSFPIVAPRNAVVQKVRQSASAQDFPRKVLC